MKLKVGVLFPPSKMYPLITKEFMDGFRYILEKENVSDKIEIILRNIPNHEQAHVLTNELQSLYLQDGVHTNVAFVSNNLLAELQSSILGYKKPLSILNFGGKIPRSDEDGNFMNEHPLVLDFSRETANWRSLVIAGYWAAQNLGKKLAYGTYFYESGFGFTYAFTEGFLAGGGEIVAAHVAPLNPAPDDYQQFTTKIDESGADVVFACYSERDALGFFKNQQNTNIKVPVVCSDKMFQHVILDQLDFVPEGFYSCATWFENEPPLSDYFKDFEKETGERTTWFNKIGAEIGEVFAQTVKLPDLQPGNGPQLAEKTQELYAKQSKNPHRVVQTTRDNSSGKIAFNTQLLIDPAMDGAIEELIHKVVQSYPHAQASGWSHAYLIN